MSARALVTGLVLGVAIGIASIAQAADNALELNDAGTAAYRRGEYNVALDRFQRAYQINGSAALHFKMGLSLQALSRNAEAVSAYENFLALAPNAPADARETARAQIQKLLPLVGWIDLSCVTPGLFLSIGPRGIGTTPFARPIAVDPGEHLLVLKGTGFKEAHASARVVAEQHVKVAINPEAAPSVPQSIDLVTHYPPIPAPPPSIPAPPPVAHNGKWLVRRWWFWTAVVVVAGGVVTAATLPNVRPYSEPSTTLGTIRPF